MNLCPCGSMANYDACCEPIITGREPAQTAEQLMRSRYAAFAKAAVDHIIQTTHPGHRQGLDADGTRRWAEESVWEGLEIVTTSRGGVDDTEGSVEFIARYRERGVKKIHHELAQFLKHEGRWFFTDGATVPQKPLQVAKTGRNEPCTCGSGAKFKKCCGK